MLKYPTGKSQNTQDKQSHSDEDANKPTRTLANKGHNAEAGENQRVQFEDWLRDYYFENDTLKSLTSQVVTTKTYNEIFKLLTLSNLSQEKKAKKYVIFCIIIILA